MNKSKLIQLADKYAAKTASKEEIATFEKFLETLQQSNTALKVVTTPEQQEKAYQNIAAKLRLAKRPKRYITKVRTLMAVASIALLGVFIWNLWQPKNIMVVAEKGAITSVNLPDGSVITLNANSKLTYPETFKGATRKVSLEGEAFFKVHRDTLHPFIIDANGYQTKVLGTSFNINAKKSKYLKVSVNTGKVRVTPNKNAAAAVELTKNEQATFAENQLTAITHESSMDFSAWTHKVILLKETTMEDLETILEDWYNVAIIIHDDSLKKETLSGKFKDEPLENVLKSIAVIKSLTIKTNDKNEIVISRKTKQ
ncbi:FecR family protein [Pustulibacterium marinum]|uniref:FecR family protein n=1 Tax=Pustulibacterium marinum TaxID=1224947 RepID=A0A1I7GEU2_9FLAO|nr:FecR domain-containing protein [Pustulibacterium marinum]SFU46982.1 FecR family protein [Pustulibacterium marinum]